MSRTCRVGVHGRNHPDFHDLDFQVLREAKVEAVKMMSQTKPAMFERIKRELPAAELITRLHEDRIGSGHHPSPQDYVTKMIPILTMLQPYCEKFHITNEPNHVHRYEGWGSTDEDAKNFNQWFLEVYDRLKQAHPWAKLGFPGLAVPDFLHRDRHWLGICAEAVETADWLGVHCYWQTPNDGRPSVMFNDNFGLTFKYYHQQFPSKTLEILECGNSNIQSNIPISEDDVAREYTDWLEEVFKYPYINSASFFILSSQDTGNWSFFSWREEGGRIKPVVHRVAQMGRPQRVGVIINKPKPIAPTPEQPPQPDDTPEEPDTTDDTATPDSFTKQNIIDAMYKVGKALGIEPEPWGLLSQAGLSLDKLAGDRDSVYDGPPLRRLHLSSEERKLVREELAILAPNFDPSESAGEPITFANQNVIDAFSKAAAKLGLSDPWGLLSKAGLSLGGLAADRWADYDGERISRNQYLSEEEKSAVKVELLTILGLDLDTEIPNFAPPGEAGDYLHGQDELVGIPLAMPATEQIKMAQAKIAVERQVVEVWNRYGWVLTVLSDFLGISLPLTVAIVAAKKNRRGLDNNGRLLIRFEPHLFQAHVAHETFEKLFLVETDAPWRGHEWRASADQSWQDVHASQTAEWEAFESAQQINSEAAMQSTSMGIPGTLGCNHSLLGYSSATEMFAAFASSERCQLIGLFDLIAGPGQDSREIRALQMDDIHTFAVLYKGGPASAEYIGLLQQGVIAFERLRSVG